MSYIKLHPSDAAKYGAPERVDFALNAIGVRQRAAVERATKRSLRWMFDGLQGRPELDEHDNPIPEPVLDDDDNPVFEADGVTPKVEPKLVRDPEALAMFVYLVLWGAGIRPAWDTFDLREIGLEVHIADEDDDEASEGKDEPPAETTDSASTPIG